MKVEFDQHFLENDEILEKEIKVSNINKEDIIVEIGPGDCRLSKLILGKSPKKLIGIEMDGKLEEGLVKLKNEYSNFEYIIGNGLDEIKSIKFGKLISNVPYSITEPLYKYLMLAKIKIVILLHGKKFYKQILSTKSKWSYFVNSFYEVQLIEEVDGDNFKPITKVKSTLVKLELKLDEKLTKKELFFQSLFLRENRSVKNAFIYSLVEIGKTKKESIKIINELNLNDETSQMKLENISNKSFEYIISKLLCKIE